MAELDPEKIGRSGVDPVTGSILSPEVRNALLKKSTIDASVFQNIENRRAQTDAQNAELSKGQNEALLGFNSTLKAIKADIVKLGTSLSGIALLLQQDALEDQNRIKVEQEKERLLAERKIRIGKESAIEQKIQNAVAEPVQRLVPKVNDIFGRIGTALGILFGGWLTKQVVDAIKASEEGNTKLFNEIRFNIVKNVGIVIGGLVAIRAGFSLIRRTIGTIARGLTKLLIAKPLALAASLIPGLGGRKPPSVPGTPTPKGGKFGLMSLIGKTITGLSAGMNFLNGENIDAALAAMSIIPGKGVIFKGLRVAAGTLFTIDEVMEAFGGNLTGEKKKELEEAKTKKPESKPVAPKVDTPQTSTPVAPKVDTPQTSTPVAPKVDTPQTSTPVAPKVDTPQSPTKPEVTSQSISTPQVTPQETMMGDQKPSTSAPSPDMEKKFEQAWQYRNNPMARGRIEDSWNKMTPDQQQQAKTWAQTKGYDWSEMKLKDAVDMSDLKEQPSKTKSAEISPAQVTMPPKEPQQVGQLPEPKPSLTMIKTSSGQQQQSNPPLSNEPLTDVPLINSANPDNFYVLYSQLNYNVVM
jgi:hypothetical protein